MTYNYNSFRKEILSKNPTDPAIPRIEDDKSECCFKSYIYIWREKVFLGRFLTFEDAETAHSLAYDKMGYFAVFEGNHEKFRNFVLEKLELSKKVNGLFK